VIEHPIEFNLPLFGTDLASGIHANQFSDEESEKISTFLKRAYVRLNSWFQWFNSTQTGELSYDILWSILFIRNLVTNDA
jgi:mannosyl-oligosaccharide glucosidase